MTRRPYAPRRRELPVPLYLAARCDVFSRLAPLRVALCAGGASAERDISLLSGAQVHAALLAAGHHVTEFDPAAGDATRCSADGLDRDLFDVCFIALHGGDGEDGTFQTQLQRAGLPYTGSGPRASRRAMSKSLAKRCFQRSSVATPPAVLLDAAASPAQIVGAYAASGVGFPAVIKPDAQGSSLGVARVDSPTDLLAAVGQAACYGRRVLAERWLPGREFTVAVLTIASLGPQPLPLVEILSGAGVFDYRWKYQAGSAAHALATALDPSQAASLAQLAVAATVALKTRGLARVDLRLDAAGRPQVLEVNTVPGLTADSLAPFAAAAAGLDLPTLCDLLLRDAIFRSGPIARRSPTARFGHLAQPSRLPASR